MPIIDLNQLPAPDVVEELDLKPFSLNARRH